MTAPNPKTRSSPRSVPAGSCDPVNTTASGNSYASNNEMVESPSSSSPNALARFEYEAGKTKDCTKVLMLEWEDDNITRDVQGEWEVSWDNKRTVLAARGTSDRGISRLYFLLTAGERVPGTIRLALVPDDKDAVTTPIVWKANPLPAIFPPELGASAREAGKKGVLHTIWAKRRLQVLSAEIEHESKENVEGVALAMALREKEWIEENFGVQAKPANAQAKHRDALKGIDHLSARSPSSPGSPESGRLMNKLRGMKLNINTTQDRTPEGQSDDPTEPDFSDNLNPLSPEQSDVAVSSFGSFAAVKGVPNPRTLAAKPPQRPGSKGTTPSSASNLLAQQRFGSCSSLDAMAMGSGHAQDSHEDDREEDLFALPMSPRSPDAARSPFSIGAADSRRYVGAG